MTICRSKASITFALLLLGSAGTTRAQQTPAPTQQPSAQQPATPPAQLPAVHLVQAGETLWSLAQQYFGDPLLWPEIYRINTDVVEDPHWIYPGEELRLTAPAFVAVEQPARPDSPTVVAVTPQADSARPEPAAPQATRPDAPTIFSRVNQRQSVTGAALEVDVSQSYRAVREGEYYSAAFLTEGETLPTGLLLGNVQASAIRRLGTSTSAQQFTEVALRPPDDSLRVGDVLIALRRVGELRGYGDVIRPTGLLRVTAPGNERAAARVVSLYGAVVDGQEVMRVPPYRMDPARRPVDVSDGVQGEVIGLVSPGDMVQLQSGVFLNRGASDGVRLGDTFQLLGADRGRTDFADQMLVLAEAVVVNVRSHTATAIIVSLNRPDVRTGATARQIRRMPS